jgi:hypothetical protein
MKKRIYRIQFIKSSFDLNEDYDTFNGQDKDAISGMLPSGYFEYNNFEGKYTLYIILKPTEADKYSKILDENLVVHSIRDISEELLDGLDLNTALLPFVGALNIDRYRSFKTKLEKWIMSNLDIDRILDRINEVGMPNISKLEKKFLDEYQ